MPVNQMGGIYSEYPQLVPQLSFTTVKDYDDWIARLHAIPAAFDQVTANMSIGMDDKRVPPKSLLQNTLEQVKQLANQKPEDSPLALPLKKFPASISSRRAGPHQDRNARCHQQRSAARVSRALPASLKSSYIPAGRAEPGISALSDGAKYYKYLIRRSTTTNLTADQIHQIGLDEVKKDEAEMLAIAQKLGFEDLKSFQESLKTNPKLKATSPQALLDAYLGYIKPMQAKLPQLFGRLPKAPFEVAAVPDYPGEDFRARLLRAGHPRRQPTRPHPHQHLQRHRSQSLRRRNHRVPRRHPRPSSADLHRARTARHSRVPQILRLLSLL